MIIATGARWRDDGIGRNQWEPIEGHELQHVFTPEDVMNGTILKGRVLIYDDDHYYMGSVLAELLLQESCQVTLVTPAPLIAYWTQYTLEQAHIQRRLMKSGVKIFTQQILKEIHLKNVTLTCSVTGQTSEVSADAIVLVTDRIPNDELYQTLKPVYRDGGLNSLRVIGDAEAPNIIAQAVFSGHQAARKFDEIPISDTPFRIERVRV